MDDSIRRIQGSRVDKASGDMVRKKIRDIPNRAEVGTSEGVIARREDGVIA